MNVSAKTRNITAAVVFILYFVMSLLFILIREKIGMPLSICYYAAFTVPVLGLLTFFRKIPLAVQAFFASACFMGLAVFYSSSGDDIRTMSGVFLGIICISTIYQMISLNISEAIFIAGYYTYICIFRHDLYEKSFVNSVDALFSFCVVGVGIAMTVIFITWNRKMAKLSEQKAQEAAAAAQAKADFLANMSHEIRTPMNAICGMAELLANSETSPSTAEYIKTIRISSANLMDIINDVLDFSKIDAGKMEIAELPYDVSTLITEVKSIIATRLSKKNIAFVISVNPKLPCELLGDENRIKQILLNILNNAVKFTENGRIMLSVDFERLHTSDGTKKIRLRYTVTDTGIGIKPDDLKKLFSEFSQVDTKRNMILSISLYTFRSNFLDKSKVMV